MYNKQLKPVYKFCPVTKINLSYFILFQSILSILQGVLSNRLSKRVEIRVYVSYSLCQQAYLGVKLIGWYPKREEKGRKFRLSKNHTVILYLPTANQSSQSVSAIS